MKVTVIGTGYVGLVVGAGLADFGHHVICVDLDETRIETLRAGEIPFFEPGLEEIVRNNSKSESLAGSPGLVSRESGDRNRLTFSTDTKTAVAGAEVIMLAVGTPQNDDGSADISAVLRAAEEVGRSLTDWAVIVTKSTVPVGTSEKVRQAVATTATVDFAVAANPEFLKQGDAVADFVRPARIVVGTDNERAEEVLRKLYKPFSRVGNKLQHMSIASAELAKYGANALLASRITFMNELALLSERVGADIDEVRRVIASDPRIGPRYLFPGAGYGGSCFPKDVRALRLMGAQHGLELKIADATDRANERQKQVLAGYVTDVFGADLTGRTIAVWGASFKPNTDDVREAPSIVFIEAILAKGAKVRVSDPVALANLERELGTTVEYVADKYAATKGADALVLLTEWHSYRTPDFDYLAELMAGRNLFDGRGVWDDAAAAERGFSVRAVGRAPAAMNEDKTPNV